MSAKWATREPATWNFTCTARLTSKKAQPLLESSYAENRKSCRRHSTSDTAQIKLQRSIRTMLKTPSRSRIARLNRRQRKKHHVAEFEELGFTLYVRFHAPQPDAEFGQFMDAFIAVVEQHRLLLGGLGGRPPIVETDGFIVAESGSVSAAQRDALLEWLRNWPAVSEARASEWQDAWYGWDD